MTQFFGDAMIRSARWLPSGLGSRAIVVACVMAAAVLAVGFPAQARALQPALPEEVRDLPLRVLPTATPSPVIALVMSGDGNWASFITGLADGLVAQGIPVVGLESRAYLAREKTPEVLTADMVRVLRTYIRLWGAERILIVGYSRGADFAPFLVNRLPADLRARVVGVGLFSPTRRASFTFHLTDLVRYTPRDSDLPAVPEVVALAPLRVLCVYGARDADTLCPLLPDGVATIRAEDSGHRLPNPARLARILFDAVVPAVDQAVPREAVVAIGGRRQVHRTRSLCAYTVVPANARVPLLFAGNRTRAASERTERRVVDRHRRHSPPPIPFPPPPPVRATDSPPL
jgi:pimeloyl-ACP methyl ester carboxylesterase